MKSIIFSKARDVELFLMPPNWFGSIFSLMLSYIHLHGKDSVVLLAIGVKEIGRRSDLILCGGKTFGNGTTSAVFHRDGMIP